MFEGVVRFVERVRYLQRTLLEPPPEPDLSPQNIGRLVKGGRKIEAMKVFHGATDAGLAESKAGVETIAEFGGDPRP